MMIKRYVTDSMPEAMQMINRDLGKDAVILNQKEIYVGGFLGFFRKRKFEVIAAKDPQQNQKAARDMLTNVLQQAAGKGQNNAALAAAVQALGSQMPLQQTGTAPAAQNGIGAGNALLQNPVLQQLLNQQGIQTGAIPSATTAHASPVAQAIQPPVQTAPSQMAAQLYGQSKPAAQPHASAAANQSSATSSVGASAGAGKMDATSSKATAVAEAEADPDLLNELRQMREMLKTLKQDRLTDDLPPVLRVFKDRLIDQEMSDGIVAELMASVLSEPDINWKKADEQTVRELCYERIREKLKSTCGTPVPPISHRVVHFVGPTGVGKTTTLAKLAAEQVLKHKKKVGFITSDTYRISAVDQLKTYASILNVPIEVVNSPTDLPKAMKNLDECDIIFMDTAGRNFRNPMYISELNNLLKQNPESLTFLVLSLTTKYKDMRAITNNFSSFKIDHVLFTKIDETESYGSIVNIIQEFDLPPSYIANGQNVPNDIFPFEAEKVAELILGERNV